MKSIYYIENGIYTGEFIELGFILNFGSLEDKKNMNGLSHVFEHLLVNYLREKWSKKSGKVLFQAYTEFDHMYLYAVCENKYNIIVDLLKVYEETFVYIDINEKSINLAKEQVKSECRELCHKDIEQRKIISYITNNNINISPLGKEKTVDVIQLHDLNNVYVDNYIHCNKALIIIGNVNGRAINYINNHYIEKKANFKENELGGLSIVNEYCYNSKHFIQYEGKKSSLVKRMQLVLLKYMISFEIGNSISNIYEKDISTDYRFLYFDLNNNIKINHIFEKIDNVKFSQIVQEFKKDITNLYESGEFMNLGDYRIDFIKNFLYYDTVLKWDFSEVTEIVDNISIYDMYEIIYKEGLEHIC